MYSYVSTSKNAILHIYVDIFLRIPKWNSKHTTLWPRQIRSVQYFAATVFFSLEIPYSISNFQNFYVFQHTSLLLLLFSPFNAIQPNNPTLPCKNAILIFHFFFFFLFSWKLCFLHFNLSKMPLHCIAICLP